MFVLTYMALYCSQPRSPLRAHLKVSPECHCVHKTKHHTRTSKALMRNVRFTEGFLERSRGFTPRTAVQISWKATINTSIFQSVAGGCLLFPPPLRPHLLSARPPSVSSLLHPTFTRQPPKLRSKVYPSLRFPRPVLAPIPSAKQRLFLKILCL